MAELEINPRWQMGPGFDPTNPLHRDTADRRFRRGVYAAELKTLLATADVDPVLRTVIDQHAPTPNRNGWDECHGCPESCCFGPEEWPCATAELIGTGLGLPVVPAWDPRP